MKIWIDLTNSPHVPFFEGLIEELGGDHEILLTCRPLANTIDLLDARRYKYVVVGTHYGASLIRKACGFWIRCFQLWRVLRKKHVDVAISHSSFYSPLVSWILGIPCIYLNDNEHAAGNRIAFAFATTIMIPESLELAKVVAQGACPKKVIQYPGVKEGIYLWRLMGAHHDGQMKPAGTFLRTEPRTAQYYAGSENFMDQLILELVANGRVVVLPRDSVQKEYYRQERFRNVEVPDKPLALSDIFEQCNLFIGAGGTMTREAAVMGIPTVSVYQGDLLDVDRYLIQTRYLLHCPNLKRETLLAAVRAAVRQQPSAELLKMGELAYRQIVETLLTLGNAESN
ncbi:MAG: DUF354 domain-containing protein [Pirellulaceae bacterium]